MSPSIDVLNPRRPKQIAIVASNSSTAKQTGWPIGFWWSELTHPFWEFIEHGYKVNIYSPDGGKLQADRWSDPRDESKYSADHLISLRFICSPQRSALVENSQPLAQLKSAHYDAVLLVGGQGPMYTFYNVCFYEEKSGRDGNLVTSQQQYSGTVVARLVIEALGSLSELTTE